MKWIIALCVFAWSVEGSGKEKIELADERTQFICGPHTRMIEMYINQRMYLRRELKKEAGKSKDELMYRIELFEAERLADEYEAKAWELSKKCMEKIK